MIAFAIKKVLWTIPSLWLIATTVFVLLRLAPGGPFDGERALSPELTAQLEAHYGLCSPDLKGSKWVSCMGTQYVQFMTGLAKGDLGPSFKYEGISVREIIAQSLPTSMLLGLLGLIWAMFIGIGAGTLGALKQNTPTDVLTMGIAMLGISIPRFVLAPLLILIFSLTAGWLPAARWDSWTHAILPSFCAGILHAAYVARLTRAGMLDALRQDYVTAARARGLSESRVVICHAMRGGLLPVVSFLGPGIASLLVGNLVVEKIFDIPGMGRYFIEAATNRDLNLMMGVTLVYAALLLALNVLVDIAFAWLDPRVRSS